MNKKIYLYGVILIVLLSILWVGLKAMAPATSIDGPVIQDEN